LKNRIRVDSHNNREILIVDYSGLKYSDIIDLADSARIKIVDMGRNDILLLEIMKDIITDRVVDDALKKYSASIKPYVFRYAVVGVSGLVRVLSKSLNIFKLRKLTAFKNEQDAKEYLTCKATGPKHNLMPKSASDILVKHQKN
jgi:hypothetical protein